MAIQQGFAEVNGTQLYYELAGAGHPLVFIHAWTLDTRMWDPQFEIFARQFQVLRYDIRGHGKSAAPTDENYTEVEDLRSLMLHLGIEHAYLIGLSMGGCIAMDFALAYPEMTDALITVDTTLGGYQWTPEYGAALEALWPICKTEGLQSAKKYWVNFEIFPPARENPEVAARLKELIDDYSGIHWAEDVPPLILKAKDPPLVQRISEIRAPTLIIVGARDAPDFHIIADLLHQHIPKARKVVLPDVWHMANMEDPDRFNKIVFNFLADL